jgi:DNA-binding GntR family transcriptional regulator
MPKLRSQVLADELRAKIESGEWPAGTKLPSRTQLCEEYGLAGSTVFQAMMILRDTGLIEAIEGVGLYVAERP